MLACRDCCVSFGAARVLRGATLTLRAGETVAVVGANGAGKSTLLKVLSGEIAPSSGVAELDGTLLARLGAEALARRRAVMPQASPLAFPFSVVEIVRLGAEAGGAPARRHGAIVAAALRAVGLAGFEDRLVPSLSGGEAQRVHLARAFAQIEAAAGPDGPRDGQPGRFLLLDEPTASLDLQHQILALSAARRASRGAGGVGVLAILHDLNLAVLAADRIVALAGGRIVADGPPASVVSDAFIRQVYGVAIPVSRTPAPPTPFVLPQMAPSLDPAG